MPRKKTTVGEDGLMSLNFNDCRDLGRLYCSYGGSNKPVDGNFYWGLFNIGYSTHWFIQIACGSYSDGSMRMFRRVFHSGNTWTSWTPL